MKELQVFAIGSDVITCLVTYQCRWWDERTRKTEWLVESEIKPKNGERRTMRITPREAS